MRSHSYRDSYPKITKTSLPLPQGHSESAIKEAAQIKQYPSPSARHTFELLCARATSTSGIELAVSLPPLVEEDSKSSPHHGSSRCHSCDEAVHRPGLSE